MNLNEFTTTEIEAMIVALTEVLCTQTLPEGTSTTSEEFADHMLKRGACETARTKLDTHLQQRGVSI